MTDTSRRLIEVRPSRGERWTALLFACALLALLVATVYFSRAARLDDPLVLAAVAGAVALLAFIWAYQGAERVRLTDQTIERIDMFSREVRRLDRISTIRVVEDLDGGRELQLTGSERQAPMVLPTYPCRTRACERGSTPCRIPDGMRSSGRRPESRPTNGWAPTSRLAVAG